MVKNLSNLSAVSLLFSITIFDKIRWSKTLVFGQYYNLSFFSKTTGLCPILTLILAVLVYILYFIDNKAINQYLNNYYRILEVVSPFVEGGRKGVSSSVCLR